MTILILGRGKTGSLAAEVAVERKQNIRVIGAKENISCGALTAEKLRDIDIVIDFTAPHCVLAHIEACVQAGKNMVVGTTGWYDEIDRVRALVEQHGTGFVYSPNFSVGVNLFLDVARAAAAIGLPVAGLFSDAYDRRLPAELTPAGRLVVGLPDPNLLDRGLAGLLAGAGALQILTLELAHARHTNPDLIRREQAPYRRAAQHAESSDDW